MKYGWKVTENIDKIIIIVYNDIMYIESETVELKQKLIFDNDKKIFKNYGIVLYYFIGMELIWSLNIKILMRLII